MAKIETLDKKILAKVAANLADAEFWDLVSERVAQSNITPAGEKAPHVLHFAMLLFDRYWAAVHDYPRLAGDPALLSETNNRRLRRADFLAHEGKEDRDPTIWRHNSLQVGWERIPVARRVLVGAEREQPKEGVQYIDDLPHIIPNAIYSVTASDGWKGDGTIEGLQNIPLPWNVEVTNQLDGATLKKCLKSGLKADYSVIGVK